MAQPGEPPRALLEVRLIFIKVMGCKWSPEGNGAFALRICRLVHPNSRSRQAEARIMVNSSPRIWDKRDVTNMEVWAVGPPVPL